MDDFLDVTLWNRHNGWDYIMTALLISEIAVAYISVEGDNETLYVFTKNGRAHIFRPDNIDRKMWPSEDYFEYAYVIISDGKWVIDEDKWNDRTGSDWHGFSSNGFQVHENDYVVSRKDGSTGTIMIISRDNILRP